MSGNVRLQEMHLNCLEVIAVALRPQKWLLFLEVSISYKDVGLSTVPFKYGLP